MVSFNEKPGEYTKSTENKQNPTKLNFFNGKQYCTTKAANIFRKFLSSQADWIFVDSIEYQN